jgi:hypothetical protein
MTQVTIIPNAVASSGDNADAHPAIHGRLISLDLKDYDMKIFPLDP